MPLNACQHLLVIALINNSISDNSPYVHHLFINMNEGINQFKKPDKGNTYYTVHTDY